ncbi:MAG: class I SAM-dependent methyltransferase [Nitrospinae bacterium]|nr:class I SAM-dependent methyltransferase [Nitrospinota bacterium]
MNEQKDSEIKIEFNAEMAEKYSAMIRTTIPGYEDLHHMALSLLYLRVPEEGSVLVVGAGDGHELLSLKRARPTWRLTGVDPSAEMLSVARKRLSAEGFDAELFAGKTGVLPSEEKFDAATAILVMHFVRGTDGKFAFLRDIAGRLKKGAVYVHAELCAEKEEHSSAMESAWTRFQISKGQAEEEVADRNKRRANSVFPLSAEEAEKLFLESGFSDAKLFYKVLNFHGWVMTKSA